MTPQRFWSDTVAYCQPDWIDEVRAQAVQAESRRRLARYDTGTISEAACLYLRALCARFAPAVAIEIGTFIGSSTMAIAAHAGRVFTCDKDNDCLASTKRITTYPRRRSTQMLADLVNKGIRASFFFFDGRIQPDDLPLIGQLSTPGCVYAFDDHEGQEKGVINVRRLGPTLRGYALIPPPPHVADLTSTTTIACLVPA